MAEAVSLADVLEAIERLSTEDQATLVDTLLRRQAEREQKRTAGDIPDRCTPDEISHEILV